MAYTISVRHRYSPISRKFQVMDHSQEENRLMLYCTDGNQYAYFGLNNHCVRVYPDFQAHHAAVQAAENAAAALLPVVKPPLQPIQTAH